MFPSRTNENTSFTIHDNEIFQARLPRVLNKAKCSNLMGVSALELPDV